MAAQPLRFRAMWYITKVESVIGRAAHLGIKSAGEELMERSLAVVPRLTEALADSAELSVKGMEATVSYTSPYAVKQHEDQRLKHPAGKQAKYLEGPLDSGRIELHAKVGTELRKVMPRTHV